MTLVKIYCRVRGCGKLLTEVTDAPTSEHGWGHWMQVDICPKHGGGHGSIGKWVAAQQRLGRPADEVPMRRWVQWSTVRPAVEAARRAGKTTTCAM